MKLKSSPLFVIFMIVFIDLVGFGIIIPLSPYFAQNLGASPSQVGFLMAIFSLMQFIFSPFWGKLSDKHGRRPILLMSLFGSGLSYLVMAYSSDLAMLMFARALAGFFGANISTALAYIADVTSEKERSKGMGIIGAAFGLGFITGPAIGGFLSQWGFSLGDKPPFGIGFAALGAALICFLNFLLAIKVLKESLPPEKREHLPPRQSRLKSIEKFVFRPTLGTLIFSVFTSTFAMANMESTLALLVESSYGWNVTKASFAFVYVGVISVFTQGFLIRKLMPKYGEPVLMFGGFVFAGIGFTLIGLSDSIPLLMLAVTVMGLGTGCLNPSLLGSISLKASAQEQGAAMGVAQSFSSLGRILGPLCGGFIYQFYGKQFPFIFAGFVMFFALFLIFKIRKEIPNSKNKKSTDVIPDETFTKIGEYQFTNLLSGPVRFVMFDLRTENKKPELKRALQTNLDNLQTLVKEHVESTEFPIVIVDEKGDLSMEAALQLTKLKYKNVVILEGGTQSLSEEFHKSSALMLFR